MTLEAIMTSVAAFILSLGGGGAIVFMLSSWLGKVWANRLMAGDKSKHDMALERLRTELRQNAFENEVRFGRLHQTQAEVIAELYQKLDDFYSAGQDFLYGGRHFNQTTSDAFQSAKT